MIRVAILLTILFAACQNQQNSQIKDTTVIIETTGIDENLVEPDTVIYECDYLGLNPPLEKTQLFSPNLISTKVEHSAVMITPDGREMWFGRMYPAKIWYLTFKDGAWSDIEKAPLDDQYNYLYPFLSSDGNRLYFTSDRPINEGQENLHRGDGDLWYIERLEEKWGEPIYLGDGINFGNRHAIGSVSANGNIYYTVRTGKLYHYKTKMYFAEFENGKYKTPTIISELNTDHPLHSPYVAPDESYIIFSSFRGGMGMSDLFISFKKEDGIWSEPKNLGSNINSVAKDEFPCVSPDGRYLFFNSSRVSELNQTKIQNGPGNMYWVNAGFIEVMRPLKQE